MHRLALSRVQRFTLQVRAAARVLEGAPLELLKLEGPLDNLLCMVSASPPPPYVIPSSEPLEKGRPFPNSFVAHKLVGPRQDANSKHYVLSICVHVLILFLLH